jgi:predicted DNA repair protein MutK
MFLVGGGILVHGLDGIAAVAAASDALPGWLANAIAGVIAGGVAVAAVAFARRVGSQTRRIGGS